TAVAVLSGNALRGETCAVPGRLDPERKRDRGAPLAAPLPRDDITPARKIITWDGSPDPSRRLGRAVLRDKLPGRGNTDRFDPLRPALPAPPSERGAFS